MKPTLAELEAKAKEVCVETVVGFNDDGTRQVILAALISVACEAREDAVERCAKQLRDAAEVDRAITAAHPLAEYDIATLHMGRFLALSEWARAFKPEEPDAE